MTLNLMAINFFIIPGPQRVQSGHHIMHIYMAYLDKNALVKCPNKPAVIHLLFGSIEGPPSQNVSIFLIPTNHPSDSIYFFLIILSAKTQNIQKSLLTKVYLIPNYMHQMLEKNIVSP